MQKQMLYYNFTKKTCKMHCPAVKWLSAKQEREKQKGTKPLGASIYHKLT